MKSLWDFGFRSQDFEVSGLWDIGDLRSSCADQPQAS